MEDQSFSKMVDDDGGIGRAYHILYSCSDLWSVDWVVTPLRQQYWYVSRLVQVRLCAELFGYCMYYWYSRLRTLSVAWRQSTNKTSNRQLRPTLIKLPVFRAGEYNGNLRPTADRPYSGLAVCPNEVRKVCDAGVGPNVGKYSSRIQDRGGYQWQNWWQNQGKDAILPVALPHYNDESSGGMSVCCHSIRLPEYIIVCP